MMYLRRGEMVEADLGYRGEKETVKTPRDCKNDLEREAKNRVRARHENMNRRLKTFGVLGGTYRHKINRHVTYFRAVTVCVELAIETQSPLFDCDYY